MQFNEKCSNAHMATIRSSYLPVKEFQTLPEALRKSSSAKTRECLPGKVTPINQVAIKPYSLSPRKDPSTVVDLDPSDERSNGRWSSSPLWEGSVFVATDWAALQYLLETRHVHSPSICLLCCLSERRRHCCVQYCSVWEIEFSGGIWRLKFCWSIRKRR